MKKLKIFKCRLRHDSSGATVSLSMILTRLVFDLLMWAFTKSMLYTQSVNWTILPNFVLFLLWDSLKSIWQNFLCKRERKAIFYYNFWGKPIQHLVFPCLRDPIWQQKPGSFYYKAKIIFLHCHWDPPLSSLRQGPPCEWLNYTEHCNRYQWCPWTRQAGGFNFRFTM